MIDFNITTPARTLLSEKIESVTLPTEMGEITILPNHIPLVANLVPGEVRYKIAGKTNFFAVSGGFIEVQKGNKVTVLADTAEFGHEIDIDRAQRARDQAKQIMENTRKDDVSYADASAILEKNLARLRVARKHRTHTSRNLESGILHE
ncbi:MAG TPA: ATP synthase F1 subunit epsilon [Verrucomicrobiae bacterium]|nr:ATP synthase F1 subunit epsilon [Verrucomicrobiae bacterium]